MIMKNAVTNIDTQTLQYPSGGARSVREHGCDRARVCLAGMGVPGRPVRLFSTGCHMRTPSGGYRRAAAAVD